MEDGMKGLMFQVFPDGNGYFIWVAFTFAMVIVARSSRRFGRRDEAEEDARRFVE
jgi:hypothetical protein